jgi:hypothetical protein
MGKLGKNVGRMPALPKKNQKNKKGAGAAPSREFLLDSRG